MRRWQLDLCGRKLFPGLISRLLVHGHTMAANACEVKRWHRRCLSGNWLYKNQLWKTQQTQPTLAASRFPRNAAAPRHPTFGAVADSVR